MNKDDELLPMRLRVITALRAYNYKRNGQAGGYQKIGTVSEEGKVLAAALKALDEHEFQTKA